MSLTARPPRPGSARRSPPPGSGRAGSRRASSGRSDTATGPRRKGADRRPTRAWIPVTAGLAWTVLLVGAIALSSLATAVVMVPVAVVAAVSARRVRAGRTRGLDSLALVGATVVVPLVALAGPLAAAAALVVFGGGALALALLQGTGIRRAAPAFVPLIAVTAVVVARHQGSTLALALVASTLVYDMAAFIMGNGRNALGGAVGIASGVVSVGVAAVFVTAILNPPMSGARPIVVFVGVAILAPLGVWLCAKAVGGERLPAARRFDSLALTAPFWVLTTAVLLHR